MWDEEITLVSSDGFTEDELGQQNPKIKKTVVLGFEKPMNRSEFYQAGQSGIELSHTLIIHPFEYNNEQQLIFRDKLLTVVRSYRASNEELELICRKKAGDSNSE
ncbi:phage head closure protein [Lactococcus sp. bn62]|uniref:phage head closure protein n=1 Tax=Lactococcus sp. bn62 TaxID=3037457 RepID=UPI0024C4D8F0|nr:phage head closure protein [Lactococcus sp. bn62]WKY24652.1 phage head closure protein [Lactococcus sp. bn62]